MRSGIEGWRMMGLAWMGKRVRDREREVGMRVRQMRQGVRREERERGRRMEMERWCGNRCLWGMYQGGEGGAGAGGKVKAGAGASRVR